MQEMINGDLAGITDMSKARAASRGPRGHAFFKACKQLKDAHGAFFAVCEVCGLAESEVTDAWTRAIDQSGTWDKCRAYLVMFSAARSMFGELADKNMTRTQALESMLGQLDATPMASLPSFVRQEVECKLKEEQQGGLEPPAQVPLPDVAGTDVEEEEKHHG